MRRNVIYEGNDIYVRPAIYEAKSTFMRDDAGDLP
jgi:hypothetical protein